MWRSIGKTIVAMTAWAVVHSVLATTASKRAAARALGERHTEGLYRLGYNGVAVATTVVLMIYLHRLPDRELYRVRGVARLPLTSLRLAMLLVALRAAIEIGIGPFSGFSEALRWAAGQRTYPAPEGQGPATLEGSEGWVLQTGGPFRYVRHPLNASATAMVFLTPTMTLVRLTVATVTLLYAVVGSKREEGRLLAMYGAAYKRYMESGVPFLLPRLRTPAVGSQVA